MKARSFTYSLLILLTFLLVTACFSPWQGDDKDKGRISITLGNGAARWTETPGVALNTLKYELTLFSMPSEVPVDSATINPGGTSYTFNNVRPGNYTVTVVATLNGYNYAYGENLGINVIAGSATPASISLQRLPFSSSIISLGTISGGIVLDQIPSYTYSDVAAGYTVQPSLSLTMTNYAEDTTGTGLLTITLSTLDFSWSSLVLSLSKDGAGALSVAPVTGLSSGTYNATLSISGANGATLEPALDLSFMVNLFNVSTMAGSGSFGSADGLGIFAQFYNPDGIAVDGSGNVYVAEFSSHTIRKIDSSGNVSTLAGIAGTNGFADGSGVSAQFDSPNGVDVDSSGNVYVADFHNNRIRKISGGIVSTFAGTGAQDSVDGPGASAQFNRPSGVAVDSSGNVYVADQFGQRIRKITSSGVVSTLAGTVTAGWNDGPGASAQFNFPSEVAVDSSGNVYVADLVGHRIRKIDSGGNVSTLAGTGVPGFADGPGASAQFNNPNGVAVDGSGNVYVADMENHRIRKIDSRGFVSTLAGGVQGFADGSGASAQFSYPKGVAVDSSGYLYVADFDNHRIRKIILAP